MPRPTFASDIIDYVDDLFGDIEWLRKEEWEPAKPVPGGKGPVIRESDYGWHKNNELKGRYPTPEIREDEIRTKDYGRMKLRMENDESGYPVMKEYKTPIDTLDKMPMKSGVNPPKGSLGHDPDYDPRSLRNIKS